MLLVSMVMLLVSLVMSCRGTALTAHLITTRRPLIAAVFAPDALPGSCVRQGAIA
jgi:hypothetical protein